MLKSPENFQKFSGDLHTLPTYFELTYCNTFGYEKFAYMLPTWFPGFAYMLPTCCLHVFPVFCPIFWFFLHNFFTIGVPFWQSASGTLPSIKLRLAVNQVTPCRRSSYASTPSKYYFDDVKPMFWHRETYALTTWKLRFDTMKVPLFSLMHQIVI